MTTLLHFLLTADPATPRADDVRAWWSAWSHSAARRSDPIEDAIAGGMSADRLGYAFAAGYHAALRSLFPSLDRAHLAALAATEAGGAHPRAIQSSLRPDGDAFVLSGHKRWSTLSPEADELFVVASLGTDEAGKNRLRIARIPRTAAGVTISPMPQTPFAPEIPHAEIRFERVRLRHDQLLEGDGWQRYVKPFRTIEDLHVHGALLGYLIGVARRSAFPEADVERLAALAVTVCALAHEPPDAPETHLAVAGVLEMTTAAVAALEPAWQRASEAERERWQRDQGLLQVASTARTARKNRAWQRLSGVEIDGARS